MDGRDERVGDEGRTIPLPVHKILQSKQKNSENLVEESFDVSFAEGRSFRVTRRQDLEN